MTAAQDRAAGAVAWLAEHGGSATPGALGMALGLGNRARQAEVTRALTDAGWAVRDGSVIRLTEAGWATLGAVDPIGAGAALDRVAAVLPEWAEPHRAYLRLLVCAIIARRHLRVARPDRHLAFGALGAPGTAKTVLGELACRTLGLAPRVHMIDLSDQTRGSLRGRREQGPDGWRLEPSALASLPFALVDELDKAPAAARAQVWPYLRGDGVVVIEGAEHAISPVVMVTSNPADPADPFGILPAGTGRRAVLLGTDYLGSRTRDIGRHLRRTLPELDPRAVVALDRVKMPVGRLPADALEVLEDLDRLTTPAYPVLPVEGLELAALGRLALLGAGREIEAAIATAVDWLQVTGARPGLIVPDWPAQMRAVASWARAGADGSVSAVWAQAERQRAEVAELARSATLQRELAADTLTEDRARTVDHLTKWVAALAPSRVKSWTPAEQEQAAGWRARLDRLKVEASQVRSRDALDRLTERAGITLREAHALMVGKRQAAEQAAERQRQADEQDAQRRQMAAQRAAAERAERAAATEREREVKALAKTRLDQLMTKITTLEKWYRANGLPGALGYPEGVLEQAGLIHSRVLPRPDQPTSGLAGFLAKMSNARDMVEWTTHTGARIGTALDDASPPGLNVWGEGTRRIVGPELHELHAAEDQLRAALGRKPRASRPVVDPKHRERLQPPRPQLPPAVAMAAELTGLPPSRFAGMLPPDRFATAAMPTPGYGPRTIPGRTSPPGRVADWR